MAEVRLIRRRDDRGCLERFIMDQSPMSLAFVIALPVSATVLLISSIAYVHTDNYEAKNQALATAIVSGTTTALTSGYLLYEHGSNLASKAWSCCSSFWSKCRKAPNDPSEPDNELGEGKRYGG